MSLRLAVRVTEHTGALVRFGHDVVHPGIEGGLFLRVASVAGQTDDALSTWSFTLLLHRADDTRCFEAVHNGHLCGTIAGISGR